MASQRPISEIILAAAVVAALGLASSVGSTAAAQGAHPPDGLVVFINASSASVSVAVDGRSICTIAPGSRCTTILTGDVYTDHSVFAQSGSRDWSDSIQIAECHANYLGTKTYTFFDDDVPFSCERE